MIRRTMLLGATLGSGLWLAGALISAAEPALPSCPGAPGMEAAQQADNPRQLEQQVLLLDRAARNAYQALPTENFQIAEAQQALGDEPMQIYHWVRDETRWLPYAGALRGAKGVLLDRSGSSLDRALLLIALLESAGHTARLATGQLGSAERQRLENAWQQQPVAQWLELPAPTPEAIQAAADQQQVPAAELEAKYHQDRQQFAQLREQLHQQARRQVASIQGQQNGVVVSQADDALQNHWWVQWQGSQGWRDLDPALPDLQFGDRLVGQDAGNLEFHYAEELPDEYHHWLTIEVVAEQLDQGQLHEHLALELRIPASDLAGQQFTIDTSPLRLPAVQPLIDGGAARDNLHQTLLSQTQWLPYVRYGDEVVRQKLINADGSVEDPMDGTLTSAATQAISSAIGALDALTTQPDTDGSQAEPELTAVNLRFRVEAPGQETEVLERPLMDILGPALRSTGNVEFELSDAQRDQRAAALLGSLELMTQTSWLPAEQLAFWHYRDVLNSRQGLLGAAYTLSNDDFSFAADILESSTSRRKILDELAGLRQAMSVNPENITLTRLNLLAHVNLVEYQNGELELRSGIDIIDNRIDVVGAGDAATIRMTQGVLDTLLEAQLMVADVAAASGNTAAAFWHDTDASVNWQRITDSTELGTLAWTPDEDALAHFTAALASGRVLIMPSTLQHGTQPSWWQLDPVRGDLLGYGPDRRGQMIESILGLMDSIDRANSAALMAATIWMCAINEGANADCCVQEAATQQYISIVAGMGVGRIRQSVIQSGASSMAETTMFKLFDKGAGMQEGLLIGDLTSSIDNVAGCR